MVVACQSPAGPGFVEGYLRLTAEAARQSGCRLVRLPDRIDAATLKGALAYLVPAARPEPALFSGYLLDWRLYDLLAAELAERGARLVQTRAESQRAMELSRWYPALADLTAASVVLSTDEDLAQAAGLGWPLFVKGEVKSRKEEGLAACFAGDEDELLAHWRRAQARGEALVARRLLPLKDLGGTVNGFPRKREWRVYLHDDEVLGLGPYWGGDDRLTRAEQGAVEALAVEASRRLRCPLLAVDVGQLEDDAWVVVEVGDPQYSGLAHLPRHLFFERLQERLERPERLEARR